MAKPEVTVTLKTPILFGTETISEMTFKGVKGKHLRALPMSPNVGDILDLAGRICGQPPKVMNELDADDLGEVMAAVQSFLPDSLTGGDKS